MLRPQTMRGEERGPRGRGSVGTMAHASRRQLLGLVTEQPVCFGGQRQAAGQCQRRLIPRESNLSSHLPQESGARPRQRSSPLILNRSSACPNTVLQDCVNVGSGPHPGGAVDVMSEGRTSCTL